MREVDVEQQARRLYGANDDISRCTKARVGRHRVRHTTSVGGDAYRRSGKSWLFMLPAAGSVDGVTAVIVPTISLRQDLIGSMSSRRYPVCGMERFEAAISREDHIGHARVGRFPGVWTVHRRESGPCTN